MEKRTLDFKWSNLFFAASLFITVAFTVSCEVGLGEAVDVSAPTLSISYPPSGAVIRDSFVLAGECSDDVSVANVNVRVVNTSSGIEFFKGTASLSGKNWQVTLNDKNDSLYASTNGWQYPDGSYEITAWAADDSGKTSGVSSRSFDIDNTAPFFIISKPGRPVSKTGENALPSAYGSSFAVTGTIADLHEISKMSLDVYDANGNLITDSSSSDKGKNFFETSIATAGGSSVEFSNSTRTAGENAVAYQRYVTLYGEADIDSKGAGTKKYSCSVKLVDSAKVYKNPDDEGSGEGNSTSQVYIYDDVYSKYLSSSSGLGLSAANLMNISNGTQVHGSLSKDELKSMALDTESFGDGKDDS